MSRLFGKNTANIANITQGVKLYSGLDEIIGGDAIDLRVEFHNILNGAPNLKPKGHYVSVKHNLLDKPTKEFDPVFKEARGKDPWEYEMQHVLTYRASTALSQYNEQPLAPGLIQYDYYIYYFEYNIKIGLHDFIYEYGLVNGQSLNLNNIPTPTERYNIKLIDPRRADNGRIEYIRVVAILDQGHRT